MNMHKLPEATEVVSTPLPIDAELSRLGVVEYLGATFGRLSIAMLRTRDGIHVGGFNTPFPTSKFDPATGVRKARENAIKALGSFRRSIAARQDTQFFVGTALVPTDAGGGP